MSETNNCPRCVQEIQTSRLRADPVVCNSCGHVLSPSQRSTEEGMERSFLYMTFAAAILIVAGFIHVANWGAASFEIIGLKIGEISGMNSSASFERMAQICLDLKKYECTERMYAQLAREDFRQLARLGKFQLSQRKFKEAADSFRQFFAAGGGDLEVNYMYAKALGEIGEIEEASKHFDYVLAAKPDVLQITVLQNYVRFLISANHLDLAKKVIQRARRQGQTVSSFMEEELKDIIQRQGGKA